MSQDEQVEDWGSAFSQSPAAAPTVSANDDDWSSSFSQSPHNSPYAVLPSRNPAIPYDPQAEDWSSAFTLGASSESSDDEPTSVAGKVWSWINKPLIDLHRDGASGFEAGAEDFASGLTSPLNLGIAVATLGTGTVESALVRGGMEAVEAANTVRKVKLATDLGFLANFGYQGITRDLPQLRQFWKEYDSLPEGPRKDKALEALERYGTDTVLSSVAAGLATKGIAGDVEAIGSNSPKGLAMANRDYSNGVFEYQAGNQIGSGQAAQLHDKIVQAVPNALRREAISNYIEANGDTSLLQKWQAQAESSPGTKQYAPGYEAAQSLTEKEKNVAAQARSVLVGWEKALQARDLLPADGGRLNYLPHRYEFEDQDPPTGQTVDKTSADGERDFLKKRLYDSYAEAEQAGLKPKTKDLAALVADYGERASNVAARHDLAKDLSKGTMNDGAPMAAQGQPYMGGVAPPHDVPLNATEVEQLKASGKLQDLLRRGRVYISAPPVAGAPIEARPSRLLPEDAGEEAGRTVLPHAPEPTYMWRLSDYVNSNLSVPVPRPVGTPELAAIVARPDVNGLPGDAFLRQGDSGIPTDPRTGQPMQRVPVYVNPEITPHLQAMLETTAPKSQLLQQVLKASSGAKSLLLSLSPFHWVTILNRSMEAGLNPVTGVKEMFMPTPVDYFNLTDAQQAAIRDGVVAANTRPSYSGFLSSEGVTAGNESLASKIPIIGKYNRVIEDRLFGPHGYITALKFKLYDELKSDLQERNPQLGAEQAGRVAASQVNNKFGGLNYTVMGRSASTQNALRSFLLAPDFLESTGRSVLDVAGKHGTGLLQSLVAFNAAQWLLARAVNYVGTGSYHPEAGLNVVSADGKKEYGLRSTLGDYLHFVNAPREFLMNRVNPTLVRVPLELATKVDTQGHKVSDDQLFWDSLRQVIPIPAQALTPKQQVSQSSASDDFLKGMGIESKKVFSPAEILAMQKASGRSSYQPLEGAALEKAQKRFKLVDDARNAFEAPDPSGRGPAMQALVAASKGADAVFTPKEVSQEVTKIRTYPSRLTSTVSHLAAR